jgi:hypothetical protein
MEGQSQVLGGPHSLLSLAGQALVWGPDRYTDVLGRGTVHPEPLRQGVHKVSLLCTKGL